LWCCCVSVCCGLGWVEGGVPPKKTRTNGQPAPIFCLHAPSENLRRTY
jgi:hypothetical protein